MEGDADPRHAIRIERIRKQFANGVLAVADVDLSVAVGEFVTLVGASGCGKSTLLRIIAGLIPVTQGQVEVNGSQVTGPRQDVGMMFQRPTLLPWKTALENVLLPKQLQGSRGRQDDSHARELLETLGLAGFENTYPAHLSGGMQQRVALARLLMIGANTLLLDEPFAAVDEITRERLNTELLQIHAKTGATIVLVTHNILEAVMLANRVVVMTPRPGRISRVVNVPLAWPRSIATTKSVEFTEVLFQARAALETVEDTEQAA